MLFGHYIIPRKCTGMDATQRFFVNNACETSLHDSSLTVVGLLKTLDRYREAWHFSYRGGGGF